MYRHQEFVKNEFRELKGSIKLILQMNSQIMEKLGMKANPNEIHSNEKKNSDIYK